MIGNHFRPWGELNWLISKLPKVKWDLIACLSVEDRFIGTLLSLNENDQINRSLFLKVIDPPSKETSIINNKLQVNQTTLKSVVNSGTEIEDHDLLEPYKDIINSVSRFWEKSDGNIIVDISAFPKRFFFPIIKWLMQHELKSLIVTYTTPKKYSNDELSGNPHSWGHLPLFMPVEYPEPKIDVAIVGVGFMPFALPDLLLTTYNATPVKFLFPFPPGPPNYQRTWDFMRKIEKSFTFKPIDSIIRLDSNNMPDAFEYITQETDYGNKNPLFAPYGPKPISLAMCLYATLKDSPVYYTQPTQYHPEYSVGIKDTYGYCITLSGKNLYSV